VAPVSKPIDVGNVIRRVLAIYAKRGALVILVALTISLIVAGLDALVRGVRVVGLLSIPVGFTADAVLIGMLVALAADMQDGRGDAGVTQLASAVRPVLGRLIVVSVVAGVGAIVGLVLLVVPGLVLLTIWAVFPPVVVLERPPGLEALGRSRDLVRGNGWRVFALVFLPALLPLAISGAVRLAHGPEAASTTFVGTLITPIKALLSAALYFELRSAASRSGLQPAPARRHPQSESTIQRLRKQHQQPRSDDA
jgi:hypothetical protein